MSAPALTAVRPDRIAARREAVRDDHVRWLVVSAEAVADLPDLVVRRQLHRLPTPRLTLPDDQVDEDAGGVGGVDPPNTLLLQAVMVAPGRLLRDPSPVVGLGQIVSVVVASTVAEDRRGGDDPDRGALYQDLEGSQLRRARPSGHVLSSLSAASAASVLARFSPSRK
jgi:hypothetical protein